MPRTPQPVAAILVLLFLLIAFPSQSIATTVDSEKMSDENSEDTVGEEILEAIYTLGGLLGSGGNSSRGTSGSESTTEVIETLGGGLPPIDPGDENGAAPVPEPTAALLFGLGILAVATRRSLKIQASGERRILEL